MNTKATTLNYEILCNEIPTGKKFILKADCIKAMEKLWKQKKYGYTYKKISKHENNLL